MTPVIEARELHRHFDGIDPVRGASLAIHEGESVSLVGPSGCGKSTLLYMLGLLDGPNAGEVLLDGKNAGQLHRRERARLRLAHIGFVFQQHNLLGHMTARENVALPCWRATGDPREAFTRAGALLERFGLSQRADRPASRLSVGESQRVAIARALVNRPRLVLADEPTGSLDSHSSNVVMDALEEVCKDGAALLVVTHDPEVAARGKRIVHMQDGRLTQ